MRRVVPAPAEIAAKPQVLHEVVPVAVARPVAVAPAPHVQPSLRPRRPTTRVAEVDLSGLRRMSGFRGGCLMDSLSGQVLAREAGTGDAEGSIRSTLAVARANLQAMAELGPDQAVEDIQIAMGREFHLLRPLDGAPRYLVCVTLDREAANLGLARIQLRRVTQSVRL